MKRVGVKVKYIYPEGEILKVQPSKLWDLKETIRKRIA